MRILLGRVYAFVAIIGVSTLTLGTSCFVAGARINTTRSIPVGLYWISNGPIERGAYVMFCPPAIDVFAEAKERGYITGGFCPGDYGYMMKRILAAKGSVVTVTSDGVLVDGKMLEYSKPYQADPAGRPLPRYQSSQYTLGSNELLLMSDVSSSSFDARYFGPVDRSQVKSVIRPIFIW